MEIPTIRGIIFRWSRIKEEKNVNSKTGAIRIGQPPFKK
jgi:hypothetical protein